MKPVLALRHVPHETLGTIEKALAGAGLCSRYVDLFDTVVERLDLDRTAGIVVLGGPMNVEETDKYPFLAPEIGWIRQAVERGVPVLGVCLGAQLLAVALGAKVTPGALKEIGWYQIELTPQAEQDCLFAGCPQKGTVFQWHGDSFELPAGAVKLARSELCENQAFCFAGHAYGLQFHVEVTAEMVARWLEVPENRRELAGLGYIDPDAVRRNTPHALPKMEALGDRILARFAEKCVQK